MATVTSDEGYFQITACTFTPKVVAVGETATFSITIKNISGKSVTSCYVRMYGSYPSPATTSGSFPDVYLHGGPSFAMKSISWGNNVSQTFTGTYTFTKGFYAVDESNYVFPTGNSSKMFLTIVSNATFTNGTNYSNFSDIRANGENLCVLSKRDNPKLSMEMERTPNDESTTVKTSVKLSADVTSTVLTNHGYTFKLYRSSAHDPATTSDTQTTLNCTLAQMYTGVTNSTSAVTTTFSNQSEWYFTLVLTNGYETAVANTSIPRAFANVHLSGCASGGVAFGKFSAATEGSPIFECEYPAKFDAGIKGVTNYTTDEAATGGTWIDGKAIYRKIVRFNAVVGSDKTAQDPSTGQTIKISNVDTVVRIEGMSKWNGYNRLFVPLNFSTGNSGYTTVWTYGTPAEVHYGTTAACEITAVLFYTKTN